jgi:hypothetical protein
MVIISLSLLTLYCLPVEKWAGLQICSTIASFVFNFASNKTPWQ